MCCIWRSITNYLKFTCLQVASMDTQAKWYTLIGPHLHPWWKTKSNLCTCFPLGYVCTSWKSVDAYIVCSHTWWNYVHDCSIRTLYGTMCLDSTQIQSKLGICLDLLRFKSGISFGFGIIKLNNGPSKKLWSTQSKPKFKQDIYENNID